jgi:hypothetical protein
MARKSQAIDCKRFFIGKGWRFYCIETGRIMESTPGKGRQEMKRSPSRRSRRVHPFLYATALIFLAGGVTFAADPSREIPVARDRGGSEFKVDIAQDGTRQTATPTASLAEPTWDRITGQIERRTGIDLRQADSLDGAPQAPRPEGTPEKEITARDAKALLKTLRDCIRNQGSSAGPPPPSAEPPPAAPASGSGGRHATVEGGSASPMGRN